MGATIGMRSLYWWVCFATAHQPSRPSAAVLQGGNSGGARQPGSMSELLSGGRRPRREGGEGGERGPRGGGPRGGGGEGGGYRGREGGSFRRFNRDRAIERAGARASDEPDLAVRPANWLSRFGCYLC